jgi:hypothetical protein
VGPRLLRQFEGHAGASSGQSKGATRVRDRCQVGSRAVGLVWSRGDSQRKDWGHYGAIRISFDFPDSDIAPSLL